MPDIRTTMQPDRVIKVDEAELLDLDRQGLVLEVVTSPVAIKTPVQMASTSDQSKTSQKPKPEEAN